MWNSKIGSRPPDKSVLFKKKSIENEQHSLLECPAYKLLREDFILKLEKLAINGRTRLCFNNRKYFYGLLDSNNNIIVKLMIK